MKPSFKANLAGTGFSGLLGLIVLYKEEIIDFLRIITSLLRKLIH